tara:strand:- start:655 stop:1005 length:351 start_codon:yes stop_codon:yes gene_type:complete
MSEEIKLKPKCLTGEIQMAYTNRGHLIPCCYCDQVRTMRDPEFQKLLKVSKVSEVSDIEEIIYSKEWMDFEENLRNNKGPWACINTCRVRPDDKDIVRKETYISPETGEVLGVRKV